MFHISCVIALFLVIVLVLEFGVQWYFVLVFISNFDKYSGECSFHTHYNVYRARTMPQKYSSFSQISLAKSVNVTFVTIAFCCLCFFKSVLKTHVENHSTKNQIDAEIQATLKLVPARKLTAEKISYRLSREIAPECNFSHFCQMDYLLLLLA